MFTVIDLVELATDNIFECNIYELNKEKIVFDGMLADIPDELLECELCSWDIATEGKITFNIEM